MVRPTIYNLMYRWGAPWDEVGVRKDLLDLLARGVVDPVGYPRAIDLGCGTGANAVHLASLGFEVWGVDFSEVAIAKARKRAARANTDARFVIGDLTSEDIPEISGQFDFLIDFGTLDDLRGEARRAMARTATKLARSGAKFLEMCFYGVTAELPPISFKGTSRLSHIAPGELEGLLGEDWTIDSFASYPESLIEVFLLTRQ